MEIKNVKGGYDYLPQEKKIRNYINDTLRRIFEEYGYNSIETPILCYYDILSDKYDGDNDILKEIYKLSDQGDRQLGLRYDLTVPFAKFIALNKSRLSLPFKRYEIAKVFRDGPIKMGRDREFTQCDVDVVGLSGQLIEAELLTLFERAFRQLGIDIIIKYNSRNLLNGLIIESEIDEDLIPSVTTVIDKLEKITKEEFYNYMFEFGLSRRKIQELEVNLNMSLDELNNKYKDTTNQLIKVGLEEINNLNGYINELNLSDVCVFIPTLARGQNYYTGCVFEVYDKQLRITSSIGAGGRYDNMITDFIDDGCKYPAVGISFGLSSIYEILKSNSIFEDTSNTNIFIIPIEDEVWSLKLANEIRSFGYNVDVEMQKRKLKKSLDYANREKIPYVIILGRDEINNNCFRLKDMSSALEYEISLDNVIKIKDIIVR